MLKVDKQLLTQSQNYHSASMDFIKIIILLLSFSLQLNSKSSPIPENNQGDLSNAIKLLTEEIESGASKQHLLIVFILIFILKVKVFFVCVITNPHQKNIFIHCHLLLLLINYHQEKYTNGII